MHLKAIKPEFSDVEFDCSKDPLTINDKVIYRVNELKKRNISVRLDKDLSDFSNVDDELI